MSYQAKHRRIPLAQAAAAVAARAGGTERSWSAPGRSAAAVTGHAAAVSGPAAAVSAGQAVAPATAAFGALATIAPPAAASAARAARVIAPLSARARTALLLAGVAAMTLALARFSLHAAEPSFLARMYDLGIYRDGGLIVRHAYHFRSGQPTPLYNWVSPGGGNPFTYPPFAAGFFAIMSFLPLLTVQWGMTALSLAALAMAVWLTLDAAGLPRGAVQAGGTLLVSALALWTQPVQSNLGLGQVNMLLMAAIVWDLRPARTPRPRSAARSRWWAGAATGVAAGFKLTPLVFLPYLLLTRRFRQAAVAAAAFALTVAAGFAAMPGASAAYWRSGLFDRANGTSHANVEFFFASAWNQSLRGLVSRFLEHAQVAAIPWLIAAALTLVVGLAAATWLDKDGYRMLGVLTCALTGLLISPVSWLHHWVWIAPWLAALTALALRSGGAARWLWAGLAALAWLLFAAGPSLAPLTGSQRALDVITDVPMKQPLAWHGIDALAGNAYVLAGLAGVLALFGWGVARAFTHPSRARLTGSASPEAPAVGSLAD